MVSLNKLPSLRNVLAEFRNRSLLRAAIRDGLKIGSDVRIIGKPDFGSEPYLIEIGDHVTVSAAVSLITHDGGTWVFRDRPEYAHTERFGRIKIGNNCYLGYAAILMPGVEIGDNCVVGAGALVTKSVPPNTVVAGVPAQRVCSYDQYVARVSLKSRRYHPETMSDPAKKRALLEATIGQPLAAGSPSGQASPELTWAELDPDTDRNALSGAAEHPPRITANEERLTTAR